MARVAVMFVSLIFFASCVAVPPAPSASVRISPSPTAIARQPPPGFKPPISVTCHFVGSASAGNNHATWLVDCGDGNRDARVTIGDALVAAGWGECASGLGGAAWAKDDLAISVHEIAAYETAIPVTLWYSRATGCG